MQWSNTQSIRRHKRSSRRRTRIIQHHNSAPGP
jgi:hypothetical protein